MLWFLLAIPPLSLFYIEWQKQRLQFASTYSQLGFTGQAMALRPGMRRHVPPALFLFSLTVLIFALARPQTIVNLPRVEGTVILAFDVSGSMAADDLKPTRMEAAKAAALSFVQRQPSSVQIGVVAFSTSAFAVQALTNDQEAILAAINRLTPELGTSLGEGILAGLNAIAVDYGQAPSGDSGASPLPTPTPLPSGVYTSAVILLLSDGENTAPPDPLIAAQVAAERGVRIYTIGIGSTAGTILHVNDFTVHTRLDEGTLQQLSQITGGNYYRAENEQDLRMIYENLTPRLVAKPEKIEVTSVLAGASIFILLIGGIFSLVWFGRLP